MGEVGDSNDGIPMVKPADRPRIDVCICTYQRAAVRDAMASVAAQLGVEDYDVHVIVADNDETDVARQRIADAAAQYGLRATYVHAPARNISVARNACLDAAQGQWIAFLDDDEQASPGWLAALLTEAALGQWDIVLGPVDAVYPEGAPDWLTKGDFHSTRPVWVSGRIETGYSGNVLLRRALVEADQTRFKLTLGRSGGEDNDFLYRLFDQGGRIGFAEDATVQEPVPEGRTSLPWLLRRNFRRGQTHGARLIASSSRGLPRQVSLAMAKLAFCAMLAALQVAQPRGRTQYLLRAALHWGAVRRMLGHSEITVY